MIILFKIYIIHVIRKKSRGSEFSVFAGWIGLTCVTIKMARLNIHEHQ